MRLVDNLDDWNDFPWGEHVWTHLYDQLHNVFDKHADDHLLRLKKYPKHCPTYTLSGFVFGFQVWILESFEKSHGWWIKHPNVIPRALAWSRKSIFKRSDRSNLFSNGKLDFESHFPNTRTAFSDSLNNIYLKLIDLPESDVDVAQEYLLLEELRFTLVEEERLQLEEEKLNAEANILRLEEANRLRLEEAEMLKLEEEKKKKRSAFMNSSHFQKALSRLPPDKRILMEPVSPQNNQEVKRRKIKKHGPNMNDPTIAEELNRVKPWVEDLSRWFHSVETLCLSHEIEEFLCDPDRHRCKFPWSDDYTVDRNFWLRLVCLDPARKGWLTEEHIDLWVDYMWHVRPQNANWAMVSSYFVQILLQNGMPVFYADGTRYPMPWNDVEQVKLPVVLEQANVFDKTGIHPNDYKISFRLAENVPKQGGIFGDCGVWVCIFLYRLAHGLSLHVDDPADVALAYREKMIQFFYKHRFYRLY